jgi:hypothetical protein
MTRRHISYAMLAFIALALLPFAGCYLSWCYNESFYFLALNNSLVVHKLAFSIAVC